MRTPLKLLAGLLLPALLCAGARAVEPSPAGPAVASVVSHILARGHYEHRPMSAEMSDQALTNYIESYDYNHLYFTKEDVAAFRREYGSDLGDRVKRGDLAPAYAIFDRFMARLKERRALVDSILASTVTFTADESIPLDWHKRPWPQDEDEARERWRLSVKFELLRSRLDGEKGEDPVKAVTSHYDSLESNYRQFDASDVIQNYLSSVCRVYDPHTDYFAAPGEDNFNISMRLTLVGIGASLRSEKGYTSVMGLVPGGPADTDKRLRVGDKIVGVSQGDTEDFTDLVGMKIDRVVRLIRGEKGTVVRLRVIPVDAADPSTRVVIRLIRDEIRLRDQEAKARLLSVPDGSGAVRKVGVIDLPSFYADLRGRPDGKSTTRDVGALIGSLVRKGAQALVIDLRRNGGGSLQEALALTGLFIGDGPVVQVKDNRGTVSVLESDAGAASYEGPVVVLTSRGSASASEILAAALQDYGRAVVIGAKSTFGKGTVQSVMELDRYMPPSLESHRPGAVHLTIQKFYRVSGGSTQNRGVIPDIALPSAEDYMEMAESALPNAMPYDAIAPARYTPSTFVGRMLPGLVEASRRRVESSPEWAYAREDIADFKKQSEEKAISLNEARRRAEKAEDEARDKARRKERAARGAAAFESLDITLDQPDGVVPSTATASVPKAHAGGKEKDGDYEKAPPAPDLMLDEAALVAADMVSRSAIAGRKSPADLPR